MKLIIDDKACRKHKMSLEEMLYTLAIRYSKNPIEMKQNLLNKQVLIQNDGQLFVTQHWSDVLDEIICDSSSNLSDERLDELAVKIQEAFPPGFKQDERTGAKYYHKSNKKAIAQALKKFITYFGDYPDEEIINAAKRYVADFRGNYSYPFQMANYFVYKDLTRKGGEITSQLSTYLDNKRDEEDIVSVEEDWRRYARN